MRLVSPNEKAPEGTAHWLEAYDAAGNMVAQHVLRVSAPADTYTLKLRPLLVRVDTQDAEAKLLALL